MRQFNLKLNPKECIFEVSSGKLLGYIISRIGIEIDPKRSKLLWIYLHKEELDNSEVFKETYKWLIGSWLN